MNTVYVLGAGASRALNDRSPLNNDLLPRILKDQKSNRVKEFIQEFYFDGKLMSDDQLPSFEEVLTMVDWFLMNESDEKNFRKLRDDLIFGISRVMKKSLESAIPNSNDVNSLTERFISNLDQSDSIVSLNYDLLIDNELIRGGTRVLYYSKMRNETTKSVPKARRQRRNSIEEIELLKLHGSLNWLYCKQCQALDYSGLEKASIRIYSENLLCEICGEAYQDTLITPTLLKNYNFGYLEEIWRRASHLLTLADRVVFVGYSAPDADVRVRAMVSGSIYMNRLNRTNKKAKSLEILVIDLESQKKSPTHQRYSDLLRTEVNYQPIGFKAFIENGNTV